MVWLTLRRCEVLMIAVAVMTLLRILVVIPAQLAPVMGLRQLVHHPAGPTRRQWPFVESVTIRGHRLMMADLLRLANVPNLTSCGLLKKMERFAIRTVITDSSIPPDPLHVTFLTLSGVPKLPSGCMPSW